MIETTRSTDSNCSICVKQGYLLVHLLKKDIEWLGDSAQKLKQYVMAGKNIPHELCDACACSLGLDLGSLVGMFEDDVRHAIKMSNMWKRGLRLDLGRTLTDSRSG